MCPCYPSGKYRRPKTPVSGQPYSCGFVYSDSSTSVSNGIQGFGQPPIAPLRLSSDFINLYTDLGISTHPHNFFSERGDDIDEVTLACKANWHYVWLITQRAPKPSERCVCESLAALLLRHFIHQHGRSRLVRCVEAVLCRLIVSPPTGKRYSSREAQGWANSYGGRGRIDRKTSCAWLLLRRPTGYGRTTITTVTNPTPAGTRGRTWMPTTQAYLLGLGH